jgi:hypothetical protein
LERNYGVGSGEPQVVEGNKEIMDILIGEGGAVNVKKGEYGTAIQAKVVDDMKNYEDGYPGRFEC